MFRPGILTALTVAIVATGAQATTPSADETFPRPDSMREGVTFWKNVWTVWTVGQVVLHDTRNPGIVYEVFELPPPIEVVEEPFVSMVGMSPGSMQPRYRFPGVWF